MFGDEVGALVLDIGSTNARVGFAGDDIPKAVFPSVGGYVPDTTTDAVKYDVGNRKPFFHKANQEIKHAVKDGLVEDWDVYEQLLEYAFRDHLHVDPLEHPLMIAEASYNTTDRREKLLELAFETFQVPAVFLCKDACLGAFSVGKSSALIIDIGGGKTSVVPVLDGHVLNKGLKHTKVSGSTVDAMLEKALFTDKKEEVVPRYKFKRTLDSNSSLVATPLDLLHTTSSYHSFMSQQLIHDIKASVCRVSETDFDASVNANIPTVQYELPDGKTIEVGAERFSVPECLFRPDQSVRDVVGTDFDVLGRGRGGSGKKVVFEGLAKMVSDSIEAVDVDVRKELYSNLALTGGGSLLPHLNTRLFGELSNHTSPAYRVKVHADKLSQEKLFGVWTGGSILGSLGSFHQMWFSKAEYEESGDRIGAILAQKFP